MAGEFVERKWVAAGEARPAAFRRNSRGPVLGRNCAFGVVPVRPTAGTWPVIGASLMALNQRESIMGSVANAVHREPWNKGKIVGQKAPFKLKDIWALRVRLQMEGLARELESTVRYLGNRVGRRFGNRRTD